MDQHVGMERDAQGLSRGLAEVRKLREKFLPYLAVTPIRRFCYEVQEAYEVRGMLDLAEMVILSARARKETRGHHYRPDYPHTEENPFHTLIRFMSGKHRITQIPVMRLKG